MKKKTHSINFLILYIFSIIPILLRPKIYFNLIYSGIPILIYLYYGLDLKKLSKSFLVSLIPSLSYFIMIFFFAEENLKRGLLYERSLNLFSLKIVLKIYETQLQYAIAASFRVFLLSFLSFTTTFMLDIWQIFKFFMIKKVISFSYGYAFSIALNSVSSIIDEVRRVNFLMKNRKVSPFYKGFLPVLVFGIRYSELASISLISRGFSEKRTIFNEEKINKNEFITFLIISIIILVMLLIRT